MAGLHVSAWKQMRDSMHELGSQELNNKIDHTYVSGITVRQVIQIQATSIIIHMVDTLMDNIQFGRMIWKMCIYWD